MDFPFIEKLKKSNKLNPYIFCANILFCRIIWDCHPYSWISRKRLKKIKDSKKGKNAVILCNGPSLLKTDLNLIQKSDVLTIGLNKINLLFDKTSLRPHYIIAVNPYVIKQNAHFFNSTEIPLFLKYTLTSNIKFRENIIFLHTLDIKRFAGDCSISIHEGFTVTYVALEIAYHMGISEVALVGCDHTFNTKGPANKCVQSKGTDVDHFDPNYFGPGMKWQLPDLFQSEISYHLAKHYYETHGRRIYNATEGGNLEIFPRIKLEHFILKRVLK